MQQKQIRAVIFPEGGGWIAHALEYDVCAQGRTVPEARHRLHLTLAAESDYAEKQGLSPFAGIGAAPAAILDRYNAAEEDSSDDDGSELITRLVA